MAHLALHMRRLHALRYALEPSVRWVISLFAACMLAVIVFGTVRLWSIPYLGFDYDPHTFEIERVEPGSAAAQAGVQVGDRIMYLYGRPMAEVIRSVRVVELIGPRDQPIPMIVERAGQTVSLAMAQDAPDLAFQAYKLTVALLALICWLTGYLLGVVRRHDATGSALVAIFWLGLGGVLGSVPFAQYTAFPILLGLVWLLIGVFVPLAVYIHLWFPLRFTPGGVPHKANVYLAGIILLINSAFAVWASLTQRSMIDLLTGLLRVLPFALLVGLAGSGWVLYRAYQRTTIAHRRRQIRLIAAACLSIALLWILLLVIPTILAGHSLVDKTWLELLAGAVPLAYLIGGLSSDLYRIDRLATRFLVHLGTMTLLLAGLTLISTQFLSDPMMAGIWMAIGFVVFYRPVQHSFTRLLPGSRERDQQRALEAGILGLTQTLDAPTLVTTVVQAVRGMFGQPALAFFLGDVHGSGRLTLQHHERMPDLPPCLPPSVLTEQLHATPLVVETRMLQQQFLQMALTPDEQQLLAHRAIVLWCPIQHQGHLLGLLVLGMRGDLDPYRAEDQQALQRLVAAAALAFANSATYTRQKEAEALIRQLYQRLQATQDATAQAIARELHDDLINVHVRLNIQSLKQIANQIADPALQAEIDQILESEQTVIATLRTICEHLHPTGLDDPFGLPAVLRMQVQKVQAQWQGACQLQVTGVRQPIAAHVQHEALRITKEALANAIQHADATTIMVHLQYPSTPDGQIQLSIRDNGRANQAIAPRPGHWGVRFMQESARVAGGQVAFQRQAAGGTVVIFTFPTGVDSRDGIHQELEDHAAPSAE